MLDERTQIARTELEEFEEQIPEADGATAIKNFPNSPYLPNSNGEWALDPLIDKHILNMRLLKDYFTKVYMEGLGYIIDDGTIEENSWDWKRNNDLLRSPVRRGCIVLSPYNRDTNVL